jgi:hypothetical protein
MAAAHQLLIPSITDAQTLTNTAHSAVLSPALGETFYKTRLDLVALQQSSCAVVSKGVFKTLGEQMRWVHLENAINLLQYFILGR